MTLNELITKIDELETALTVYRNGEKVEINYLADNAYEVKRVYSPKPYEICVELEEE